MNDRMEKVKEAAWARVKELAPYLSENEFKYLREKDKSETFRTFIKGYEFAQVDTLIAERDQLKTQVEELRGQVVQLKERITSLEDQLENMHYDFVYEND
jgi:chromosome segregation ATPase